MANIGQEKQLKIL